MNTNETVTISGADIATMSSVLAGVNAPVEAPKEKPPTQMLGVGGFNAAGAMGDNIDWARLVKLPPFQMFAEEREKNPLGIPSDKFAYERAIAAINTNGAAAFFAAYEKWHSEKGLWPHENAYGRPR